MQSILTRVYPWVGPLRQKTLLQSLAMSPNPAILAVQICDFRHTGFSPAH